MAEYKTPMNRNEVRETAIRQLGYFLDDVLGHSDLDESPFNRLDDEMHGLYNDLIQDGTGHRKAMNQVKEEFYDLLQAILTEGLDNFFKGFGQ